jgi:hypothetical protein
MPLLFRGERKLESKSLDKTYVTQASSLTEAFTRWAIDHLIQVLVFSVPSRSLTSSLASRGHWKGQDSTVHESETTAEPTDLKNCQ